jgi:branched-chain amino acid transport system substrate-binding protein
MTQHDCEQTTSEVQAVLTPSRRSILKAGSALGLGLLASGPLFAQDATRLRVGFVSPRTGPLASFGEPDGYILQLARAALKDGLTIGGRKYSVEILDRDTQSDPARASQLTKALISNDKVDLVLVTSTPETVNPVSDACEAAGTPCLSTETPWEAWYFGRGAKPGQPSPFQWTNHFSFGIQEFVTSYLSQWGQLTTNKKTAALLPNDADGNAVRASLSPALIKAGYNIVDAGPYETGTTDFSAQIAKFKQEQCQILFTFPIPPDFATFWRQAAQQGLAKQMKLIQMNKTGLFPSTVEVLGPLGYNLCGNCFWHKAFPYSSSLAGVTSAQLASGYEAATGKQWNQQLGPSLSLFDVAVQGLKASNDPKDKRALVKAFSTMKTTTILGQVDFTKGPVGNVATTVLLGTQWVKAAPGSKFPLELVITENAADRNVPVSRKLVPYS